MKTTENIILITGGATGIGLALSDVFLRAGNKVIICGRRNEKLLEAQEKFPNIQTKICDVSDPEDRASLYDWVMEYFPGLNIFINNAAIQKQIDFTKVSAKQSVAENEIAINFSAPFELSALFIPHLMKQKEAAIINVSSGLGFVPLTILPVYCATKAALHSFTWSLRHQLRKTSIKVFEIIPPTVDTDLDRGTRGQRRQEYRGISASEVADATMAGLTADNYEITIGQAKSLRTRTSQEAEQLFQQMNGNW
jgi:uncharacterized oxidoreductase